MSSFVGEDTKDVALWWLFAQPGVDFLANVSGEQKEVLH